METIDDRDGLFLLALNASEESSINEIKSDFENWDTSRCNVPSLLEELIREDVILLASRRFEETTDYTMAESLGFVSEYDSLHSNDLFVFLTKLGLERWENGTWGITKERVNHLMFSPSGGRSTRVQ